MKESIKPSAKSSLLVANILLCLSGCEWGVGSGNWYNPHDPDGTNYHPPIINLSDTAIHDTAKGYLHAHATSTVSHIARISWILDGTPLATTDSILPTAGWSLGSHTVSISATDATNLEGPTKTIKVWIGNQPPALQTVPSRRVAADRPAITQLLASDADGTITSVTWDTIPDRYSIESNSVDLPPLPDGGTRNFYWRATDNEGATTQADFQLTYVPAPTITMKPNRFASNVNGGSFTTLKLEPGSPFPVLVVIDIPGFADEPLSLVVSEGSNNLTCVSTSSTYAEVLGMPSGRTFNCTGAATKTTGSTNNYLYFEGKVTDRYGRTVTAQTSGGYSF